MDDREGIPEEWLPDDQTPLILEETPTRYGAITLKLEKDKDAYILTYEHSGKRSPEKLLLHWNGSVTGVAYTRLENGVIEIDGGTDSFLAVLRK